MRKPITYVAFLIVAALMLLVCVPKIIDIDIVYDIAISVTQNGDTTSTNIEAGIPCTLTISSDYPEYIDSIKVSMGASKDTVFKFSNQSVFSLTFIKTFTTVGTQSIKLSCYSSGSSTPKEFSKQITLVCSKPKVSTIKGPTSIQPTQNCTLSVSDTSLSVISLWDWYKNDTLLTLSKTSNLVITSMRASDTGSYYCIITNLCGAKDTTEKFHLAFPAKPADVTGPELTLLGIQSGTTVSQSTLTILGNVADTGSGVTSVTVKVNSSTTLITATITNGSWSALVTLPLGVDTLVITATDTKGNITTKAITVTCDPTVVKQPIILATNATITLDEGATRIISDSALKVTQSGNFVDSTLVYTLTDLPKSGTIKLGTTALVASGTFTQANIKARALSYVNNGSEAAKDSIAFTVSDGKGGSIARSVFIMSINPINDAPVITSTAITAAAQAVAYSYAPTATDQENGTLTWSLTGAPTGMAINSSTGVITWTPAAGVTTSGALTLTVTDNGTQVKNAVQTFTISVSAANYTITYNSNGSNGGTAPSAQTKIQGIAATISFNTGSLEKTGYTFSGWNTLANGNGTPYAVGASYTTDAALSLNAKWVIDTFTISFNSNGGSAVLSQRILYKGSSTLPTPSPTQTGYIFSGWYERSTFEPPSWDFATPIIISRTLYAKWTPVYTVTYNGNGSDGGTVPNSQTKTQSVTIILAQNFGNLSSTGFTFAGWNTAQNGDGVDYAVGGNYTADAAITLYAKWRMNVPVITSDPRSQSTPANTSISTLSVSATGANLGYKWQKNGSTILGAVSPEYIPPALTADDTAASMYRCIVSNTAGSDTSNGAIVSISTVTDVEGNAYHEVKIGNQIWTMENFRCRKYKDGTPISSDTISTNWSSIPEYGFYNKTTNADSIRKLGAYYNWYAINGSSGAYQIAPTGWHVPNKSEWDTLTSFLTANGYNWDNSTTLNKISKSMCAKTDWFNSTIDGAPGNNLSLNNRSGFSAIPAGYSGAIYSYSFGVKSYIWASDEPVNVSPDLYLHYDYVNSIRNSLGKSMGASLRLVKN